MDAARTVPIVLSGDLVYGGQIGFGLHRITGGFAVSFNLPLLVNIIPALLVLGHLSDLF